MPYCTHCGAQVGAGDGACASCQKPPFGPVARPAEARPAEARGGGAALWIPLAIGCAFLIVVLGIVAAIAIPNFLDALQRAKQKRTMAGLQGFGGAIETYRGEHGRLPAAESIDELIAMLAPPAPADAAPLPRQDGWGHPLRFACWPSPPASSGCDRYRVASAGRDGVFEHPDLEAYEPQTFAWGSYDRDIVWGDGAFLSYPQGSR
jgi:type II secretory pathway pseudopilin PulG